MSTTPIVAEQTIAASPTRYRWWVMALIFVIYTFATADRANIGIALPFIRKDYVMSNTEAGGIISLFFVFYSLGQIPFGFVCARFGARRIFPIFMLLTSVFTALIGTASGPFMLKFYRAGLGIMEAPLPLSLLATINNWFPSREKGTATGIFLAAAKFGPVIVPPIGALLIAAFGWRSIFYVFAVPGIFLAIAWLLMVPDDPKQSRHVNEAELEHIRQQGAPGKSKTSASSAQRFNVLDRLIRTRVIPAVETSTAVFRSSHIWACALCYFLMTGLLNVILAWLPSYLVTVKHFSLMNVGLVSAAPFVGGVLGNIAGGIVSDRVLARRRKPTMMITAASTCIMMLLLIEAPNDVIAVSLLLFVTGLMLNIGYSSFSVYPMGMTTKTTYPVAASLVNAAGQAGGALAPFVTGVLLDAYNWNAVFLFLAVCSVATFAILVAMPEPQPQMEAAA